MLKQLPVKKEYLLIAAAVFLLLVSYRFAFSNTIQAWQTNKQLKSKLEQSGDVTYQPAYLERKAGNLDKIIALYKADTTELRNNILNTISSVAEKQNVKLTEVPVQNATFHTGHFIIEKLGFEGDYFALMKTLNQLQSTKDIGMIRSFDYKVTGVKSANDGVKKLVLEVYLEMAK